MSTYRYASADAQPAHHPAKYAAADVGVPIKWSGTDAQQFKPRYVSADVKTNRYVATDVDDTA